MTTIDVTGRAARESAEGVLRIAREFVGLVPSAQIALKDADANMAAGDYVAAVRRALKSLMYSCGVGSEPHRRACQLWLRTIDPTEEAAG